MLSSLDGFSLNLRLDLANLLSWLLLIIFVGAFTYWHLTKTFNYWNDRGVFNLKPKILFGNIKERILGQRPYHICAKELYKLFEGHRYAGFYESSQPVLLIRDKELIKSIMVRDSEHFIDRPLLRFYNSPMNKFLIGLQGSEWRYVRALSTPAFSPSKLKNNEFFMKICAGQMETYLEHLLESKGNNNSTGPIEMKDFFGRYTIDIIVSWALGVQQNSYQQNEYEIFEAIRKFFEVNKIMKFHVILVSALWPQLCSFLPLTIINLNTVRFLGDLVMKIKRHRLTNPDSRRNDLLQFLMNGQLNELNQSENQQRFVKPINGHKNYSEKSYSNNIMTDDMIIAQFIVNLYAGSESSSILLSYACYELALHPDVQEKLRAEILTVLDKYDGDCNYEALLEMTYLEMVLNETLRKYPPVGRVDRLCTKRYKIPDSELVLNPGDVVAIPITGVHYDAEHFSEPEKFDPERFSTENKKERSPYTFLAYGAGPRNCIGTRLAVISNKSAMARLLRKYRFTTSQKTEIPCKFDNFYSISISPDNGIWLNVEKLL